MLDLFSHPSVGMKIDYFLLNGRNWNETQKNKKNIYRDIFLRITSIL